jgi:hypothetical protein
MNKNEKPSEKSGADKIKEVTGIENKDAKDAQQVKLGVFEEDDYFEEFEDEGKENCDLIILFILFVEWAEAQGKEEIDFKQWQEDWEDEEINDHFEKVLKAQIDGQKIK